MAIQYVIKQDKRKNGTRLFYGRAVHPSTIETRDLAKRVQRQCSLTIGDVESVITNLIMVMQDELQNSNKVKLDGLGTFYLGICSSGAISEEDYSANQNVKAVRVNFLAEGKKSSGSGKVTRTFCDDISIVKAQG